MAGPGFGVMRLLPSELDSSVQSEPGRRQISWDTLGGVTPLEGDGGHGRSRERQAGARQGIILLFILNLTLVHILGSCCWRQWSR